MALSSTMLHWSMAAALSGKPQSLSSCAMLSMTGIVVLEVVQSVFVLTRCGHYIMVLQNCDEIHQLRNFYGLYRRYRMTQRTFGPQNYIYLLAYFWGINYI